MSIAAINSMETKINACYDKDKIIKDYLPRIQAFLPKSVLPINQSDIHLQARAIRVQEVANERIALLENRQNLYNQTALPEGLPNFSPYLTDSNLKIKICHFQSCLKKVLSAQESISDIKDFTTYYGYERNDLLSLQDIEAIRGLQNDLRVDDPLYQSIQNFLDYCNNTIQNKTDLLNDLANSFDWQISFEKWSAQDQMKLLVQAEQILSNPFEPKFAISDLTDKQPKLTNLTKLILKLKNDNTASYLKSDFWDYVPELERKAHRLAEKTDLKLLLDAKKEGLLAISSKYQKLDINPFLVVGAGPAGLIQAISLAMQGKSIEIIEKRKSDKEGRPNTVTFGKWNPQELKILLFLGTLSRLEGRSSFGHNRAYYTETALSDLEIALEETLHSIRPTLNIQHEATIEKIYPDGSVDLRMPNSEILHKNFTAVIAADGARSQTRNMLGIGFKNLSRPTKLAFSIFKKNPNESSASLWKKIAYRVTNAVKGIWIIFKVLLGCLIHGQNLIQSASHVIGDGPSGLSRLNKHDYLLSIFRKKEQMVLDEYHDKIKVLKHLKQDSSSVENELENRLQEKAKALHGPLDFIHMAFRPKGHTIRPIGMVLDRTYPVDVMLRKAERSQMLLGETLFTIRGDASHTTDPYSGTGAKTAIEETVTDHYYFNIAPGKRTAFDRAILEMNFQSYQDKMFKGAFAERFDYYHGTETSEWFADLALSNKFITEIEKDLYLKVSAKKEANIPLSSEKKERAKQLRTKCLDLAKETSISLPLKHWEKKVILKALHNPSLKNSELEGILNKLCCLGHPVGALLKIATEIEWAIT